MILINQRRDLVNTTLEWSIRRFDNETQLIIPMLSAFYYDQLFVTLVMYSTSS